MARAAETVGGWQYMRDTAAAIGHDMIFETGLAVKPD
jgi:hypothetical protein